jgi:hypothetical protein
VADHHRHYGITAAAAAIHGACGREDVRRCDTRRADPLQLGGEYVQQHFGVRLGVEVAPILARDHFGELRGIGQIAVVGQTDAVGRIDVKGLGLGRVVTAGSRITHMAYADMAAQLEHVMLFEDIAHQTLALADEQLALLRGHDAGGILPAVLQYR